MVSPGSHFHPHLTGFIRFFPYQSSQVLSSSRLFIYLLTLCYASLIADDKSLPVIVVYVELHFAVDFCLFLLSLLVNFIV